ncbi:MAG: sulfotransferase [Woeseiaceae bacterium]|nr:sulfotransferase [Woeseiaceae bacterium]
MQDNDYDTPKASFDRAMTFMRGGDPVMSEKICRQALNTFPRDANLLCLLGASLIKQERASDAEHTLSRAARMYADFSRAHEGLAEALIMQGKLKPALESLLRAEKLEPHSPSIRLKKGKVLAALGDDDAANREFEESIKLTPHREDLVRGLNLQRMGNLAEAERIYRDVLVKDPANVDAMRLMAGIAMRAKQYGDAEVLLERALEIAPNYYQGWMDLGLARQEQDKGELAIEAYTRAMRIEPKRPRAYAAAGTTIAMNGEHEKAVDFFDQAIALDPGHAGALSGKGHVLKTVGRQAEAIESYRECVRANPSHGEAWWSLANLKTFRFDDDDIAAMLEQVNDETLGDEPRANFQFALGKAYEDAGDYARAFEFYEQGNENRRQRETYDPVQTADQHDQFIRIFSREFLQRNAGAGNSSNAPIFIVGLPRSGSTLIEQILASHPEVEGTHELPELGRVARGVGMQRDDRKKYPEVVTELTADEFRKLGDRYLERTLRHRTAKTPRFTDKLPNNFAHVGFASLILPNAKFIDARRHPLDSCLGSYKQLFARGQPFTYDLFELGEFYLEYRRLMAHWHDVLPGNVLDVQYEDVVADIETQVRRILEFCDLPWDDRCMRFFETERAVKTASSEQVRQPIYSDALHRWRNYETQLAPLIEVLEPLLKDLPADWQPESLREAR